MPNFQTLYEIGKLLIAETDITKFLPVAMDKVIEGTKAQRGMIMVFGDDGELLFETARHFDKQDIANPEFEISKTIIASVIERGEPVVLKNALDEDKFQQSKSITQLQLLSVACVPLRHGETNFGAIYIDNRKAAAIFDDSTGNLLQEFANLIAVAVKNALDHRKLVEKQRKLANELAEKQGYGQIIGESKAMRDILELVDEIADTDATVLITGETGTGKELIARAIHTKSSRRDQEFVALNCAAIPENLIESELFGHEKGAFTGAQQRKSGWIDVAHKGTLFLDEIGDIPLSTQVKLLRFLQSGEYSPVGQAKLKKADARIVVATNRDLAEMVQKGEFRQDLYYRLNIIEALLPPLRNRGEDVLRIADYFLMRFATQFKKANIALGEQAQKFLLTYPFPGNVRELENMMQRAVLLARGSNIEPGHLKPASHENNAAQSSVEYEELFNTAKQKVVESFEKAFLKARLKETEGNISEAARRAGMYKANFIQKMQKYGIRRIDFISG
ncbi:MAG: sigma-54 interaction domain-containing protein [bacterium]